MNILKKVMEMPEIMFKRLQHEIGILNRDIFGPGSMTDADAQRTVEWLESLSPVSDHEWEKIKSEFPETVEALQLLFSMILRSEPKTPWDRRLQERIKKDSWVQAELASTKKPAQTLNNNQGLKTAHPRRANNFGNTSKTHKSVIMDYINRTWDVGKFLRWLFNPYKTAQRLSWDYFDPYDENKKKLAHFWKIKNLKTLLKLSDNAEEGEHHYKITTNSYSDSRRYSDTHPWISWWTGKVWTEYPIELKKKNRTCILRVGLNFSAYDKCDFNKGKSFGLGGFCKDDFFLALQRNTILGYDYEIVAQSYEVFEWTWNTKK